MQLNATQSSDKILLNTTGEVALPSTKLCSFPSYTALINKVQKKTKEKGK